MDSPAQDRHEVCEVFRSGDLERLYEMKALLEARGLEVDVWPEKSRRAVPWASRSSRLMVQCSDLVYARWVVAAAGFDTWPDEPGA
jgi:hypothetical protein